MPKLRNSFDGRIRTNYDTLNQESKQRIKEIFSQTDDKLPEPAGSAHPGRLFEKNMTKNST